MLGRRRVRAGQQDPEVGAVRGTRPHLLPVDQPGAVLPPLGPGPERGQVGAGARLGEELAPGDLPAQGGECVGVALRLRPVGQQGGHDPGGDAEVGDLDPGGREFLLDDELLGGPGAQPVGRRQVGRRVAGGGQDPPGGGRVEPARILDGGARLRAVGLGLRRQLQAQRAPRTARRAPHGPYAVPVAGTEQLAGDDRPPQVDVGVVLPGEADPAEDLDAVLGAGVRGVQGGPGGEGRHERAHVGGLVHGLSCVPGQRAGLFQPDEHVGAQVLDALELPDGPAELLAHLGVLGGRVQGPGGGAARVGGEERAGEVADEGRIELQQPAGGDDRAARPHLGGGAGRVGALLRTDVQCGGVHGEPAGPVRGLRGEQHDVGLAGAEHGRREPVEQVPAALGGHGGQGPRAQRDRPDPAGEGLGPGPVQQYGGQHARQVRARQRGPGRLLDDDGQVEQGPALQVRLQEPRLGQSVPVTGPHPRPRRGIEQLAHLFGRHDPRHPAAHRLGQLPLLLRDSDAHARQTRTRSNLTEGQMRVFFPGGPGSARVSCSSGPCKGQLGFDPISHRSERPCIGRRVQGPFTPRFADRPGNKYRSTPPHWT